MKERVRVSIVVLPWRGALFRNQTVERGKIEVVRVQIQGYGATGAVFQRQCASEGEDPHREYCDFVSVPSDRHAKSVLSGEA